jgi:hypothetical protein
MTSLDIFGKALLSTEAPYIGNARDNTSLNSKYWTTINGDKGYKFFTVIKFTSSESTNIDTLIKSTNDLVFDKHGNIFSASYYLKNYLTPMSTLKISDTTNFYMNVFENPTSSYDFWTGNSTYGKDQNTTALSLKTFYNTFNSTYKLIRNIVTGESKPTNYGVLSSYIPSVDFMYFLYKGPKSIDSSGNYCWYLFYNPIHRSNFRDFYVNSLASEKTGTVNNDTTNLYIGNYCNIMTSGDGNYFFDPMCSCMNVLYGGSISDKDDPVGPKLYDDETSSTNLYSAYNSFYGNNQVWYDYTSEKLGSTALDLVNSSSNFQNCHSPACKPNSTTESYPSTSFMSYINTTRNVFPSTSSTGSCTNTSYSVTECNQNYTSAGNINISSTALNTNCGNTSNSATPTTATPTSTKNFACLNGDCTESTYGNFSSYSSCKKSCSAAVANKPWKCDVTTTGQTCVKTSDNSGYYDTEDDCKASTCGQSLTYSCSNITGTCYLDMINGKYSFAECNSACSKTTPTPTPTSQQSNNSLLSNKAVVAGALSVCIIIVIALVFFIKYLLKINDLKKTLV